MTAAAVLFVGPGGIRTAHGNSQSIITLGIGLEGGVMRHAASPNTTTETVTAEVTARLRFARFLGFAFAYNPIATDGGSLGFGASFRITGVMYLVPTRYVSVYVMGGLGARDIRDLGTVTGPTNSYHAGGGFEVYLGDHFSLHAEYLWLIPGYESIMTAARAEGGGTTEVDLGEGLEPVSVPLPSSSVWDCFDPGNFQVSVGVRYYI